MAGDRILREYVDTEIRAYASGVYLYEDIAIESGQLIRQGMVIGRKPSNNLFVPYSQTADAFASAAVPGVSWQPATATAVTAEGSNTGMQLSEPLGFRCHHGN